MAERTTGWRRIATAVWGWPEDPQIYGRIEVDAEPVLEAIRKLRAATGAHVTPTHVVTRALALALAEAPAMNTRLVHGRFVARDGVAVFVITSTGAGKDLDGVKVANADRKGCAAIADEVGGRAAALRAGQSIELEHAKRSFERLPLPILRRALRAAAWLTGDLGIDLARFGLPREAFGSAMVTSVGMFGISEGWAPLSHLYRVPLLILVGEIERRPWVVDDHVEPHRVLPITATIDHRWVDGHAIGSMSASFRKVLADPLAFEPVSPDVVGSPGFEPGTDGL